jgi:hypothetical protein
LGPQTADVCSEALVAKVRFVGSHGELEATRWPWPT